MLPFMLSAKDSILAARNLWRLYFYQQNNPRQDLTVAFLDLKDYNLISLLEIVLVVPVTLVKPSIMRKLDGINIINQLKVQNHQNTSEATSTTILHGMSFQMLQKMLRPGRT